MSKPHRKWTSSEKRAVGARQNWKCACCQKLLPATFEIDHVTPLHLGGLDCCETNAEALCNSCHAHKTLRERITMEKIRKTAILQAKAAANTLKVATRPLLGTKALLDSEPGPDFLTNRFLQFAFVRI